jgi:hypothetical protein
MSVIDWVIVAVAALVGWGIVSGIAAVVRQQRSPPYQPEPSPPSNAAPPAAGLSVAELGERWNEILGTSKEASYGEIEQAFQARLAACDAARESPEAAEAERSGAEARRARIVAAFEFIRPLRQS